MAKSDKKGLSHPYQSPVASWHLSAGPVAVVKSGLCTINKMHYEDDESYGQWCILRIHTFCLKNFSLSVAFVGRVKLNESQFESCGSGIHFLAPIEKKHLKMDAMNASVVILHSTPHSSISIFLLFTKIYEKFTSNAHRNIKCTLHTAHCALCHEEVHMINALHLGLLFSLLCFSG